MSSIALIDWLLDMLGIQHRSTTAAIDHTAGGDTITEVNPASGDVEQYVVTSCGYRIRVPQPQDMSLSVGEMLPDVRQALAQVPPLPHVVAELMREAQDSSSTAASVASVAASDPVLAAALLRTVNSSAMGLNRKITSVAEAVSYLGFALVKSVMIRLRLDEMMPTTGAAAADAEDLWIHSLATSYAAEQLADLVPGVDRGLVSTLGLLHDIGKLAMISQKTLRHSLQQSDGLTFEDDRNHEANVFGADHAGMGAQLAHAWKLPSDLVQAIRFHHHPEKAYEATDPLPLRQAMAVVFAANQLAKLAYAYNDHVSIDALPAEVAQLLNVDGGVETLLDDSVRKAIGKAILFAAENTRRPKTSIRRLLRLRHGEEAVKTIASIPADAGVAVKIEDTAAAIFDEAVENGVLCTESTTREADIARLIDTGLAAQAKLVTRGPIVAPAAQVLIALLANMVEKNHSTKIELAQQSTGKSLMIAVRCDSLGFSQRVGQWTEGTNGTRLLAAEFAGLLNVGWVKQVSCSPDGTTICVKM